jgi:hypothetical protein
MDEDALKTFAGLAAISLTVFIVVFALVGLLGHNATQNAVLKYRACTESVAVNQNVCLELLKESK